MKILLVEDNKKISDNLKSGLTILGFLVEVFEDGLQAYNHLLRNRGVYDLVLLDILLPNKNGVEICKDWRKNSINIPIIMLTALSEIDNKIEGLDGGADDYISKPFNIQEVAARINALMRRPVNFVNDILDFGFIKMDSTTHTVFFEKKEIDLTRQEFRILNYLLRHQNQVVTREQILANVWDFAFNGFSNVVDVHITNLRNKLGKGNTIIKTVRGVGYEISI